MHFFANLKTERIKSCKVDLPIKMISKLLASKAKKQSCQVAEF